MGCESSSWGQLLTKVHCLQSCWLLACIHVERPVSTAAPKHSIAQGMLSEVMAFMVTQPQGRAAWQMQPTSACKASCTRALLVAG